jgi:hypothetical protein
MLGIILIAVGLVGITTGVLLRKGTSFDDGNPATRDPSPVQSNKGGGPIFAMAIGLAARAGGLYLMIGGRFG